MVGAIVGAGLSIVASAIGSAVANARRRRAEEEYREYVAKEVDKIDEELETNYLDRADAQNALRKVTNSNEEALRQLNTDAIRGGATDEAKVAMASKLTQGTANVVGDLAAVGEQHKDRLREQKRSLQGGYASHQYNMMADTSGVDRMTSALTNAATSLGNAWDSRQGTPVDVQGEAGVTTSAMQPPAYELQVGNQRVNAQNYLKTSTR